MPCVRACESPPDRGEMAVELFIARLPPLNRIELVEAELATGQRHGPFLHHLKSKCRYIYSYSLLAQ